MPKGGPLSFLNKKTWHPGRVQNMEEVWKREQVAAKEEQKLADLRKQIAEERAREELHSMAEAAGVQVRQDRLDWMYQGGMLARQEADQRLQDQPQASAEPSSSQQPASGSQLPAFYTSDTPASANEMWQRLHSDPLFAMKQQEQVMRKRILANPVQMESIKEKVKHLRPEKKSDERARERDYSQRDEDRRRKRRSRSRSANRGLREGSDRRRREERLGREERHRHEHRRDDVRRHDRHSRRPADGSRSHRENERRTSPSRRDRGRADDRRGYIDAASAQGGRVQYGISYAHHAADVGERSERAEETRRHLERAAQKKEDEQRAAAEQARARRSQYKAGRLTDEERAARLAAMSSAADDHEQERVARVRSHTARETAEDRETAARTAGTTATFLESAQKGAFGSAGTNGTTLEEAVNRRKHFNQRGSAASGAAFRR